MRIAFTPAALPAHHFAQVPLAWACRAAGHDVRIVSQPPAVDAILGAGLVAFPVGEGFDFGPGVRTFDRMARRGVDVGAMRLVPHVWAADAMAYDLVAFLDAWRPDVLVADPLVLAAPVAAEATGVPLVRHRSGPDTARVLGYPTLGLPVDRWPTGLRRLYERFGVDVRPEYGVRTLDPCPPSLQFPEVPQGAPVRHVPYDGSGVMPRWLLRPNGRPRVCVTNGLEHGPVAATLERLGATIAPSDLPPHLVLPGCEAVVHTGAGSTLLTAAWHGVPQLVLPSTAEHALNGRRVTEAGAGLTHDADGDLADQLTRLLTDPTLSEAAGRLRAEIHTQPAPDEVVGLLTRLSAEALAAG